MFEAMTKTVAALMKVGLEDWSSESSVRCRKRMKPILLFSFYLGFFFPPLFFFAYKGHLFYKTVYFKDGNFKGIWGPVTPISPDGPNSGDELRKNLTYCSSSQLAPLDCKKIQLWQWSNCGISDMELAKPPSEPFEIKMQLWDIWNRQKCCILLQECKVLPEASNVTHSLTQSACDSN